MRKFIKTYRGAKIFEASLIDENLGKPMEVQLFAKAILPGNGNLNVDFIEKADTRKKAISQLEQDIDNYLEEHQFESFIAPENKNA